jgi:tripartite-type tricarboxylate transporter receptor subunit TctC
MFNTKRIFSVLLVLFFSIGGSSLAADKYPSQEVRMIISSGLGGGIDRMARSVQRFLPEVLGVSVLAENQAGAGGKIAMRQFLKQPADGHTLYVNLDPSLTILQKTEPDLFKMEDVSIINVNWVDPTLIMAHKDTGWKTLDDMIAACKKEPGKYSFSLPSLYATGSILGQLLFKTLGLDVKIVPYDSGGTARTAMRGKHVTMTAGGAEGMTVLDDVGVPLALFWPKPVAEYPNVPSINDVLKKHNVQVPNAGSVRFFATHTELKKKYPERWKFLVDSFHKLVNEHEGFKAYCDQAKIGREWYGPEKSTQLVMESHEIFKTVDLKKGN